jgi:hypothetical protein
MTYEKLFADHIHRVMGSYHTKESYWNYLRMQYTLNRVLPINIERELLGKAPIGNIPNYFVYINPDNGLKFFKMTSPILFSEPMSYCYTWTECYGLLERNTNSFISGFSSLIEHNNSNISHTSVSSSGEVSTEIKAALRYPNPATKRVDIRELIPLNATTIKYFRNI